MWSLLWIAPIDETLYKFLPYIFSNKSLALNVPIIMLVRHISDWIARKR